MEYINKLANVTTRIIHDLTASGPDDNESMKTLALKIVLLFKYLATISENESFSIAQRSSIESLIRKMKNWNEVQSITGFLT